MERSPRNDCPDLLPQLSHTFCIFDRDLCVALQRTSGSKRDSPPQPRRGGRDLKKISRSSLWSGRGGVGQEFPGQHHPVRAIGIGAAVTRRPLPHHRAYGSVHGGSRVWANTARTTKAVLAGLSCSCVAESDSISFPLGSWASPGTAEGLDFAVSRPLVPRSRLISGSCPSTRTFA